jgi:hypothetical protein
VADEGPIEDEETVIGVVVGIDGSNPVDVDPSVTLIDGCDELPTGLLVPDTGSTFASVFSVDDVEKVLLLPLLIGTFSDEESLVDVVSADSSVMPVLLLTVTEDRLPATDFSEDLLSVWVGSIV